MNDDTIRKAREKFVRMMKDENFYYDCNHNLQAHWRGTKEGFKVMHIQSRWQDFLAGFEAAHQLSPVKSGK